MKPNLIQSITQAWKKYWFYRPGIVSVAMIRMALGVSSIILLHESCPENFATFISQQDPALYNPWGILALLGRTIPSPEFFEFFRKTGYVFSFTLILGLWSRTSLFIALVSGLFSGVLSESFQQSWSHGNNVTFLTMIAFLLVRSGDTLSVDALLTRYLSRPNPMKSFQLDARYYFYGVLLAQFAVAMMFLNAGFWKLRRGGRYFGWVLSDNMRNLLITNRMVLGEDLPPHLHFIVMHEWAYKGLAMGNIIAQLTPILSMFLIHKPKWRALCGVMFVLEFLGLGIVMRIWVPQFLPLVVVFFDWDALFAWVKVKIANTETSYAKAATA